MFIRIYLTKIVALNNNSSCGACPVALPAVYAPIGVKLCLAMLYAQSFGRAYSDTSGASYAYVMFNL